MNPINNTGFIVRGAIDSDHSSHKAQGLEAGRAIQAPAEKELQVAHWEDHRQEAEEKWLKQERQNEKLRQRLAEKQPTRQELKRRTNAEDDQIIRHGNSPQRMTRHPPSNSVQ